MPQLPKLFDKIRFRLPADQRPTVLVDLAYDPFDEVDEQIMASGATGDTFTLEIRFWVNFWIETPLSRHEDVLKRKTRFGLHCRVPEGCSEFEDIVCTIYNNQGDNRGTFQIKDHFCKELVNASSDQIAYDELANGLAYHLHYLGQRRRLAIEQGSGHVRIGNEPTYYGVVGDTFRYERVSSAILAEASRSRGNKQDARKTEIKKREHEVIGHWRQYKSGKRVFVRGHKRGDPTLGVVTKVYRIT